jgi:hypothetical protein
MQNWTLVRVDVAATAGHAVTRTSLLVPWGILQREGPESYFACHLRFAPEASVDLGRLEAVVKAALELYLCTGVVSTMKREQQALHYAADRYLLRRLKTLLPPEVDAIENMARLQCLNCRIYVPSEDRLKPCSFKPPRRYAYCVSCGTRECGCTRTLPRHVFDSEAPPEAPM